MIEGVLKRPTDPAMLGGVAELYGTPTYVYSEAVIRRQIVLLREVLRDIPVHLSYAAKANGALPILRLMVHEGLGIDAVSPAELELALRVGFPPDRILFSANNMTDEEMHFAAESGAVLNIGELSRLESFGSAYPGSSLCVRLNPQIGAGHHQHVITAGERSKFGIPIEQMNDMRALINRYKLSLVGLHQHIGSGILDTNILWCAISIMLDIALDFDSLQFINLGGGFGIPYRPDEHALDMGAWKNEIVDPLHDYLKKHPSSDLTFVFEPGRFLVAESGTLLVRVNTLKVTKNRTFAGVDSGMGHLVRPVIYGAYHAVYNLTNPDGLLKVYDIVGNICESADFFAKERSVQEIRQGDLLAILDTGAYGMAMASMYNTRSLPSEVWVPESGAAPVLISARETVSELIDRLYPSLSVQED